MARRGRLPKGSPPVPTDVPQLLELWNRALASPHGIKIASSRQRTLVNKLYKARLECGHTAYHGLRLSYDDTHVWIVPR